MKNICKILIFCLVTNFAFAQNNVKIDTLLGDNGIFKRFQPKKIIDGQKIIFNLKVAFSGIDKKGKSVGGFIFMNTKYGYVGISHSKDFIFDPNNKKFNFMVFSNAMQNFTFLNDNKGKKTVMSMPFNPSNKKDKLDIKKSAAAPKMFAQFSLKSYAYNNGIGNNNNILFFTDANLSSSSKFNSQMAYAGLGFYQIGNKTVLCTSMEVDKSSFTIDKIEPVNIVLNTNEFKKEDLGIPKEMMEAMMKKMKKQ